MSEARVPVFFYGSFMSRDALAKAGYAPATVEVARLRGFDIRIETLATLVRDERGVVYGIVCPASHAELARLYGADMSRHYGPGFQGAYLPEPVVVETLDGRSFPALTYVAHGTPPPPPSEDYLDWILGPARELGFPAWYVARLERFRPGARG